ncbi:MAG: hypothetical protein ACREA1_07290 [Nitrosotalea sp.]
MQNEGKVVEKNICDICGTDVGAVDGSTDCPICDDRYFGKIKESYTQNLNKCNIASEDLFKLYFDLSGEFVKFSYNISSQYLEIEKNLRVYNPSWYYLLTSYQFLRNRFLGNTMQSASMMYSGFTDVWKVHFSTMSENIVSALENVNRFCNTCNETMNVQEKSHISEGNKNLIKTISVVNRTYSTYQKEEKITQNNNSENIVGVLKKK